MSSSPVSNLMTVSTELIQFLATNSSSDIVDQQLAEKVTNMMNDGWRIVAVELTKRDEVVGGIFVTVLYKNPTLLTIAWDFSDSPLQNPTFLTLRRILVTVHYKNLMLLSLSGILVTVAITNTKFFSHVCGFLRQSS